MTTPPGTSPRDFEDEDDLTMYDMQPEVQLPLPFPTNTLSDGTEVPK